MLYSFSLDSNSNFTEAVTGVCNLIKKETLAQVFSHEFCKISKKNFSYRTPPVAASVQLNNYIKFKTALLLHLISCFLLIDFPLL